MHPQYAKLLNYFKDPSSVPQRPRTVRFYLWCLQRLSLAGLSVSRAASRKFLKKANEYESMRLFMAQQNVSPEDMLTVGAYMEAAENAVIQQTTQAQSVKQ